MSAIKGIKRFFFYVILVLLTLAIIESAGRAAYYILYGKPYDLSTLSVDAGIHYLDSEPEQRENQAGPGPKYLRDEPLHPYLGFAVSRHARGSHGFNSKFSPTAPAEDKVVTVLLTGGSVAGQLNTGGLERFFNEHLAGRSPSKVRVFPVVGGGYKQPQQLQALTYFLSIGARFDVVINLDGFNDVVLPYADNAIRNIYPFYPRVWRLRLAVRGGETDQVALGEIAYLRKRQQGLVTWLDRFFIGDSAIVGIVIRQMITATNEKITRIERELLENQRTEKREDLEFNGPRFDWEGKEEVVAASIDTWARSSVLMDRIARENRIEYYHFLQPNQYVSGSKPFSSDELTHFVDPAGPYAKVAVIGYPELIEKGEYLREQGVDYFDLTGIFNDTTETVYRDRCCHFNKTGIEEIMERIVETVFDKSTKFDRQGLSEDQARTDPTGSL